MGKQVIETWLAAVTDSKPLAAIARSIGVPQRTFANHVKSGDLDVWEIALVCREYGCSILDALVDLGVVTNDEALVAAAM